MKNKTTKAICVNAVVAALYVVLSMPFGVLSTSSGLQFRPAEALTMLPALFPYTAWGLFVGCAVSNLVSAYGLYDVLLGSTVTLLAAFLTGKLKKVWLAPFPPIVLNAFLLPLIWLLGGETVYWINVGCLALTQSAVIILLGVPLYFLCDKKLRPLLSLEN